MNRQQAEHLLDAYESVIRAEKRVNVAGMHDSVREVILDAMSDTDVRYYPVYVNAPSWKPDPYKPTVTWTTESASTINDADVTRPLREAMA